MGCSLPGSSVHGIFQARLLELFAISSSRGSSWPRDRAPVSYVSCIAGRVFTRWAIGKAPLKYLLDLMASAPENIARSLILRLPAQQRFLGSLHTLHCGLRLLLQLLLESLLFFPFPFCTIQLSDSWDSSPCLLFLSPSLPSHPR